MPEVLTSQSIDRRGIIVAVRQIHLLGYVTWGQLFDQFLETAIISYSGTVILQLLAPKRWRGGGTLFFIGRPSCNLHAYCIEHQRLVTISDLFERQAYFRVALSKLSSSVLVLRYPPTYGELDSTTYLIIE